jgi:hypothetical protein
MRSRAATSDVLVQMAGTRSAKSKWTTRIATILIGALVLTMAAPPGAVRGEPKFGLASIRQRVSAPPD